MFVYFCDTRNKTQHSSSNQCHRRDVSMLCRHARLAVTRQSWASSHDSVYREDNDEHRTAALLKQSSPSAISLINSSILETMVGEEMCDASIIVNHHVRLVTEITPGPGLLPISPLGGPLPLHSTVSIRLLQGQNPECTKPSDLVLRIIQATKYVTRKWARGSLLNH